MDWQDWPRTRTAGDIDCIEAGSGAPVALIHGVGLRADAWGAQIPVLAEHYHVRAYDTPGRGGSAPVGDSYIMAGANHMLPMTHPDETNRVLLDFFRKC